MNELHIKLRVTVPSKTNQYADPEEQWKQILHTPRNHIRWKWLSDQVLSVLFHDWDAVMHELLEEKGSYHKDLLAMSENDPTKVAYKYA